MENEKKEFKIAEKEFEQICHSIDSAFASFQAANELLLKMKPQYIEGATTLFEDGKKKIIATRDKLKQILNSKN